MSQRGSNQLDLGQNESALKKKRPRCCLYIFQGKMGCRVSKRCMDFKGIAIFCESTQHVSNKKWAQFRK